ncbi:MAG: hypothetical protein ACREOU_02305 [Candidatus Eiseniibacteriota bacterium]
MRPDDLAKELGISGKTIRAWLRESFPRDEGDQHQPWHLTASQAKAVRERFSERRSRAASRDKMVVTTIALPNRVHSRLVRVALAERLAMTEAVRLAISEWLERRGRK